MSPAAHGLVVLVTAYRWLVSPVLGPCCRYRPSCSEYAVEALRAHGAARGGWLALRRISRCHPWGGHGHDPVPPPAGGR
jgi:putative membrane protein insertion efficiency factor